MKRIIAIAIFALVFFCMNISLSYSQTTPAPEEMGIKTDDVNKDGKPDVSYYSDGKYVAKVEADTNYDGKPDVIVHLKDGKFESAEADTDNDGKMDKKFSTVSEFNKWLAEGQPAFKEKLNRPDWQFELLKF